MSVVASDISRLVVEEAARSSELTASMLDLLTVVDNHYVPRSAYLGVLRGRLTPVQTAQVEMTARSRIRRWGGVATKAFMSEVFDAATGFDQLDRLDDRELPERGLRSPAALHIQATLSVERLDNAASAILHRSPALAEEYAVDQLDSELERLRPIAREEVAFLTERQLENSAVRPRSIPTTGSRSDLQSAVKYYLQGGLRTYRHTNSKGVTFLLHRKNVTLRGGKEQMIYYFTRELRPLESVAEMPIGYTVIENPRNGFPALKRK